MEILFLLLHMPEDSISSNMYIDLIREFKTHGHKITVLAPSNNKRQYQNVENGVKVIRVKSFATQGITNLLRKGFALALLPYFFKRAYKNKLANKNFDWVFMPTPPITLIDFVSYLKKKSKIKFYLILRDIHPQSAASIGLIRNRFFYNYLDKRASKGYQIADLIGCMSPGNISFIKEMYTNINPEKLVLLYNWQAENTNKEEIAGTNNRNIDLRNKYNLNNKIIALFGGNIGYGQRIENIINLARKYNDNTDLVFLVIGKGVKKMHLMSLTIKHQLKNILFIEFLPRNEYLKLIANVDIGLISIHENYQVPTCPSKAVSYMSLGIPIFAMINPNNDYGKIIEDTGAGYYVIGGEKFNDFKKFEKMLLSSKLRKNMGERGLTFFKNHLTTKHAYNSIINQINNV